MSIAVVGFLNGDDSIVALALFLLALLALDDADDTAFQDTAGEGRFVHEHKHICRIAIFGFIPSTKAEDGDPTDVLVLMDEPAFPGCVLKCRVIGVIEGQQGKKKKGERNDRVIAIEEANHSYAHIHHVKELGKKFVKELEEFFVNYHDTQGKKYRVLEIKGPAEAYRRVEDGMKRAGSQKK